MHGNLTSGGTKLFYLPCTFLKLPESHTLHNQLKESSQPPLQSPCRVQKTFLILIQPCSSLRKDLGSPVLLASVLGTFALRLKWPLGFLLFMESLKDLGLLGRDEEGLSLLHAMCCKGTLLPWVHGHGCLIRPSRMYHLALLWSSTTMRNGKELRLFTL